MQGEDPPQQDCISPDRAQAAPAARLEGEGRPACPHGGGRGACAAHWRSNPRQGRESGEQLAPDWGAETCAGAPVCAGGITDAVFLIVSLPYRPR